MTFIFCALLALVAIFLPRLALFIVTGCAFGWGWAFALLGLMFTWILLVAMFGVSDR